MALSDLGRREGWLATGLSRTMETRSDYLQGGTFEDTSPDPCAHNGLAMIHHVVGGYVARCLACQTISPIRDDSRGAREALAGHRAQGHQDASHP